MCPNFYQHIEYLFCRTAVYQYDLPMRTKAIFLLFVLLGVVGCATAVLPTPSPVSTNPTPIKQAGVAVTVIIKPTATPSPTAAAATAVPATTTIPLPIATPGPMSAYTIESLRQRDYPGGVIEIASWMADAEYFDKYAITYPSDGLTISGIMQIPKGEGPFPVIILNHGYHERDSYFSGAGTWQQAEYLNYRGYLTIAPDYRSWGSSDIGPSFFHTGLVADVMNLVASLPSIPEADTSRIGMWGHSMGGGITTKVLTISDVVKAAVLHAPNSADDADLIARWGPGCLPGLAECNDGEVIPVNLSLELQDAYLAAANSPEMLQQIAPIYHLAYVTAPVQIHIGLADGAEPEETPPDWAPKLHAALQDADKESTLFVYPEQGHFFNGPDWNLMMRRTADFFDAYLKN
ncbi:MAG: alpha/beta fold hydrolase [Ardenticatenaceae bacterium]|nr:alpha/beta fold hydrolase [Ardenticatenaceae bacterium]